MFVLNIFTAFIQVSPIWLKVNKVIYNVIFALQEILLESE